MNERTVIGTFDGEQMFGDDMQIYSVPPNYASKSRLVEGDTLKLYIELNGNYVYKQVKPVPRRQIVGTVTQALQVEAGGNTYSILPASISYYKLQPGDEVSIILPQDGLPSWAALDKVM